MMGTCKCIQTFKHTEKVLNKTTIKEKQEMGLNFSKII